MLTAARSAAAFTCSASNLDRITACLKNAPASTQSEFKSGMTDTPTHASSGRIDTPPWLDLATLGVQIYGADAKAIPGPQPAWLQTLDNFLTKSVVLLRSPLGPPVLLGMSGERDGRHNILLFARWPADNFADLHCTEPGDTDNMDSASDVGVGNTPPAGVRLLQNGTALVFTVEATAGYGGGFGVYREIVFVQATQGELKPLLCARTHILQMIAGDWNSDGTRKHVVVSDDWTWRVTKQWHNGHADVLILHDGEPAQTIEFRWSRTDGRYLAQTIKR